MAGRETEAKGGAATTRARGAIGEARALSHLQRHGLVLEARNYRVAAGPNAPGGEIDLILRDRDGTLVFVEVKARRGAGFGGGAASVGTTKQRRLIFAAEHYLRRLRSTPPCRFDVVLIEGEHIEWLRAAFDSSR